MAPRHQKNEMTKDRMKMDHVSSATLHLCFTLLTLCQALNAETGHETEAKAIQMKQHIDDHTLGFGLVNLYSNRPKGDFQDPGEEGPYLLKRTINSRPVAKLGALDKAFGEGGKLKPKMAENAVYIMVDASHIVEKSLAAKEQDAKGYQEVQWTKESNNQEVQLMNGGHRSTYVQLKFGHIVEAYKDTLHGHKSNKEELLEDLKQQLHNVSWLAEVIDKGT